jgi:hypothetical protein
MTDENTRNDETLIWDYQSGYVIDSRTGEVIDRIYDYGPQRASEEEEIWRMIRTKKNPRTHPTVRKYRRHYSMYRELESRVKDKPWLEIDYDRYLETGRMVHTIKSRASIEAERKIEERNLWGMINKGIEYIRRRNPVVLARSSRGKYALAYMVSYYLENKRLPRPDEVIEIFNISETSYRRLLKIAHEILTVRETAITY